MLFEGMLDQAAEELLPHQAHEIEISYYGKEKAVSEISIECITCSTVLVTFPKG